MASTTASAFPCCSNSVAVPRGGGGGGGGAAARGRQPAPHCVGLPGAGRDAAADAAGRPAGNGPGRASRRIGRGARRQHGAVLLAADLRPGPGLAAVHPGEVVDHLRRMRDRVDVGQGAGQQVVDRREPVAEQGPAIGQRVAAALGLGQPGHADLAARRVQVQVNPYGVRQGYVPDLGGKKSIRGAVMSGMVRDYLQDVCGSANTLWSIQDGKVVVVPETAYVPGSVPVLSHDSGLGLRQAALRSGQGLHPGDAGDPGAQRARTESGLCRQARHPQRGGPDQVPEGQSRQRQHGLDRQRHLDPPVGRTVRAPLRRCRRRK